MGVPPPPPPPREKDVEIKILQMQMEEQMKQALAESENIFEEMKEDLDNMMDFGLDFDIDEISDAVDKVVSKELDKSKERYEFGIEGGASGNATVGGVPIEKLEEDKFEWYQKLSKWLCDNTNMNMSNVRGMADDELIQLAQVLYNYTMENGEFKQGHSEAVTKEWFNIKAGRADKRIQKADDHIEEVLELIKAEWKYRIKEVLYGDG